MPSTCRHWKHWRWVHEVRHDSSTMLCHYGDGLTLSQLNCATVPCPARRHFSILPFSHVQCNRRQLENGLENMTLRLRRCPFIILIDHSASNHLCKCWSQLFCIQNSSYAWSRPGWSSSMPHSGFSHTWSVTRRLPSHKCIMDSKSSSQSYHVSMLLLFYAASAQVLRLGAGLWQMSWGLYFCFALKTRPGQPSCHVFMNIQAEMHIPSSHFRSIIPSANKSEPESPAQRLQRSQIVVLALQECHLSALEWCDFMQFSADKKVPLVVSTRLLFLHDAIWKRHEICTWRPPQVSASDFCNVMNDLSLIDPFFHVIFCIHEPPNW